MKADLEEMRTLKPCDCGRKTWQPTWFEWSSGEIQSREELAITGTSHGTFSSRPPYFQKMCVNTACSVIAIISWSWGPRYCCFWQNTSVVP